MNENIDLTKILKNCPKGTKLYSTIFGDVEFCHIDKNDIYPIKVMTEERYKGNVSANGKHYVDFNGECTLFPSKEQRDWSKFKVSKPKFDPKTLKPFDKVLVRDSRTSSWSCALYSHTRRVETKWKYVTGYSTYGYCIPYNDDTKHLVGTTDEAPEYYRYWE